jgi:hypothetical protein
MKQAEKHKVKVETLEGRKDTTKAYWLKEAENFKKRAEERMEILKKIGKVDEEEKAEDKN